MVINPFCTSLRFSQSRKSVKIAVANPNAITNVMYVSMSGVALFFPRLRAARRSSTSCSYAFSIKAFFSSGVSINLSAISTALSMREAPPPVSKFISLETTHLYEVMVTIYSRCLFFLCVYLLPSDIFVSYMVSLFQFSILLSLFSFTTINYSAIQLCYNSTWIVTDSKIVRD